MRHKLDTDTRLIRCAMLEQGGRTPFAAAAPLPPRSRLPAARPAPRLTPYLPTRPPPAAPCSSFFPTAGAWCWTTAAGTPTCPSAWRTATCSTSMCRSSTRRARWGCEGVWVGGWWWWWAWWWARVWAWHGGRAWPGTAGGRPRGAARGRAKRRARSLPPRLHRALHPYNTPHPTHTPGTGQRRLLLLLRRPAREAGGGGARRGGRQGGQGGGAQAPGARCLPPPRSLRAAPRACDALFCAGRSTCARRAAPLLPCLCPVPLC